MSATGGRRRIGRVLVALDASPSSLAAARAAARLAALLKVELLGLFVEDLELLHLSRSPMARQIDLLTGAVDRVESDEVERQFRVQALKARRALARLAEEAGLEWSFQVARGRVAKEIHAVAGDSDLVSLGRVGWSLRQRRTLGRTARALLAERRRCTLLLERPTDIRPPVAVIFDGSAVGSDALDLAESLAGTEPDSLAVLLVGEHPDRLRAQLAERFGQRRAKSACIELGKGIDSRLCQLVRSIRAGLVVVPMGDSGPSEEQVHELMHETDCPVLLVS